MSQRPGRRFLVTAGFVTLGLALPGTLAAADTAGTAFWLAFEANGDPGTQSLAILGESGTSGLVEIAGIGAGFSEPFSIPAGGLARFPLPQGTMLAASDGTASLGVHVTADRPVVVYGFEVSPASADSFLALPVAALGVDYYTVSYTPDPGPAIFKSQFAVVAATAGTTVQVTPTATVGVHPPGATYSVSLGAGEAYQGQSSGDLTGTRIQADHPVAVFSGDDWTQIPIGVGFADHLAEQLLPTAAWGTDAFVVPSATRIAPERYRVQASADNTIVTLSSGGGFTINAGQFVESTFGAPVRIEATHPVSVARFANGGDADPPPGDGSGDPFELVELDVARFAYGYRVATADDGSIFPDNFVNLVAPAAAAGRIALDGVRIPAGSFTAIGSTGYASCQQAITPGAHRLIGPLPFGASVYGFGNPSAYVSYGSPAGGASLPFADGFEGGDTLAWSVAVP